MLILKLLNLPYHCQKKNEPANYFTKKKHVPHLMPIHIIQTYDNFILIAECKNHFKKINKTNLSTEMCIYKKKT